MLEEEEPRWGLGLLRVFDWFGLGLMDFTLIPKTQKKKMRNTNIGQYIGRYIAPWPIYRPILVQNEMIKKNDLVSRLHKKKRYIDWYTNRYLEH